MISRWLALLFGFAAVTAAPRAALAQTAQTAVIRGTVSTAAGEPLVSAIVAIADLDLRQFSNTQGKFYFVNVPAGKHQLTVRQLGYAQRIRDVIVAAGETTDIDFQLERIATKLVPMQVSAKWKCDSPGRPVVADNAPLAQVFEQLEQNAVRLSLLAEQYPYDAVVSRLRLLKHADGLETVDLHDSVRTPSSSTPRYSPGKVVIQSGEAGRRREKILQVPTLLDFASTVFQENHCFLLQGIQRADGVDEIRIDFQPWSKLKTPDVSGGVFLQPVTYKLLRSEIHLTKIPAKLTGVVGVEATTYFDDIAPGMPTVGEIVGTTDLAPQGWMYPVRGVERLTTIKVVFQKQSPLKPPL